MLIADVQLHLVDVNNEVYSAFQQHFGSYQNVKCWHSRFQDLPEFDLMVSPANSFGQMDGGIDKYITEFFGTQLMDRVQEYILTEYAGEQPVGTSFIIETAHEKHPFLAHTPTMRIPQNVSKTDNAYRAMKALLLAVEKHNQVSDKKIHSIACSGLGTLVGRMRPDVSAKQMALAYRHILKPLKEIGWREAHNRHEEIENTIDKDPIPYKRTRTPFME